MTQQEFIEKQFPHSTTTFGQDLRLLIKEEAKELAVWISKKGFFITEDGSNKWLQIMDTLGEDPKTFDELYDEYERREK